MMQLESMGNLNQQSPTPTIPDHVSVVGPSQQSFREPEVTSARAHSIATETLLLPGTVRGVLDEVIEFNRNLQLDIAGDTIPNTYNPDDFVQSATEVATPSVESTPDLGVADRAVHEGKVIIDALTQLTSNLQQPVGSPGRPINATSAPGSQRWLTNSPTTPQEQLQHILQSASPQALQKLISYLAPLHNLLNSIPDVANTMRDLGSRLEMLEHGSFNYVQPEEFNQILSMYDDRIVELEHRMDEHEKHHRAIETDQGSTSSTRRCGDHVITSFGSNHSSQSTTSSALVLAAMNRKDTEMELGNIKDRLDVLEAAALPTLLQPWDIEVVLIPWGRDLRGIWFSPDEPMHDTSKTTTQNSEDWTQTRSPKVSQNLRSTQSNPQLFLRESDSSPQPGAQDFLKGSIFGDNESGWSSQAISAWASGSADDWLFPKACGSHNLVYKRLQSRGFVRHITLKSASARELQEKLSRSFNDLLEHLSYTNRDEDSVVASYPGLRASFIPLRKVHKQSKLRFLTPAEMSSSALWSAQFLSSGVLMRCSGGKKRLYVTQREAYIQHSDDLGSTWTWQELRQLPRFQLNQESQMQGNDEHCQPEVPEADAKETCWQYIEAYDAPPASVHSSFGSNQSVQLTMRPADQQWRRSITPNPILKNKILQPISPLSEFYPRPNHLRQRTISASFIEQVPASSSKRRFDSSPIKQSSAPQPTSRTPSVSMVRLKRRRTANYPSLHEEAAPAITRINVCNPTPRRSREPPSPFFSSQPVLPRSNSDVTSRPSQRSIAVLGKSTPFAYATPHSGPFVGGPAFGDYNNGGDTEPDDDNDAYEASDGEQSWRGVTDGEDDGAADSDSSGPEPPEDDSQYEANLWGNSGSEIESGDDDGEESEFDVDRNKHHNTTTTDEDEEECDVLDTLLGVLEH
ncbi:hypothetical protein GQ44DRAFT_703248 [Phaeosphaeriaceae sp. PMI808]|nr:hypothetical protein GQ44DRAFT_703248 [Phaeosphaeriaceae sp. PMI808]